MQIVNQLGLKHLHHLEKLQTHKGIEDVPNGSTITLNRSILKLVLDKTKKDNVILSNLPCKPPTWPASVLREALRKSQSIPFEVCQLQGRRPGLSIEAELKHTSKIALKNVN